MKKVIVGLFLTLLFGASAAMANDNNRTKGNWLQSFQKQEPLLKKIISQQIAKINEKANNTNSKNEKNLKGFVLSTDIASFSDINPSIDLDIKTTKKEVAELIRLVATDIELNQKQYEGILTLKENGEVVYTPTKNLPEQLEKKREKLLEANMKNGVTVKSAVIALKMLSTINNGIIEKAKEASDRSMKQKLYMKQAIYVYEMSDIVLNLLDRLTLDGTKTINELFTDAKKREANRRIEVEKSIKEAQALRAQGLISQEKLDKEIESLKLIEKASEMSLHAWDDVFKIMGNEEKFLENLKKKKALVAYKQGKAKLQIETLRDIQSVSALKSMIGSIDELVDNIDQLDLLVLDEKTVAQLLGVGEE